MTSVLILLIMTVCLGFVYPLSVWGFAQLFFPHQANGSLIEYNGMPVGSELIGQNFYSPQYFHGRPSSAGIGYDAAASGGSNYGPSNTDLLNRVTAEASKRMNDNPGKPVPADLVTASASGLDPHITPAAAEFQVPRVARARGMSETDVRAVVRSFTEQRSLGIFGEPRVNVLLLNLELDRIKPVEE